MADGILPCDRGCGCYRGGAGRLQAAVATPLQNFGDAAGLSSGQAVFTAGVATNIVLAHITGPLDEAATYIEVAGIIVGLVTGAHGLMLACLKLLSHSQFDHLLSQGFARLLQGFAGCRRAAGLVPAGDVEAASGNRFRSRQTARGHCLASDAAY